MNQSFHKQQLLRLCKKGEYIKYGKSVKELSIALDSIIDKIADNTFEFSFKRVNDYILTNDLPNKLILAKLNDNIKRIYKDQQANRRVIISQVKTLLSETCPFWVIKTDIKSFYESINRERLINKLQNDYLLSYQSMFLIKKIFDHPKLAGQSGVPRGMNISSILSEIYMRKFDKWVRSYESVYYYARFVDDIIIFSNSLKCSITLINSLNHELEILAKGLIINQKKTELYCGNTLEWLNLENGHSVKTTKKYMLNYLGYSFTKAIIPEKIVPQKIQNVNSLKYTIEDKYSVIENNQVAVVFLDTIRKEKYSTLIVSIADKKIKKIKTRIIKAFLEFSKNGDFGLLEKRIQFLTGNYSIQNSAEVNSLRAGLYYNYLQVTDLSVFENLNQLLRKTIYSKSMNFGCKIGLNKMQKSALSKYCFVAGFEKKVFFKFSYTEMQQIVKCW